MPPLDIDTLEKRFKLIQEVYSRIGTEAHPQKGKIASAISNIGSIFRSAKSPGPLPDKIHYTALKQAGRPFIQPKSFHVCGSVVTARTAGSAATSDRAAFRSPTIATRSSSPTNVGRR